MEIFFPPQNLRVKFSRRKKKIIIIVFNNAPSKRTQCVSMTRGNKLARGEHKRGGGGGGGGLLRGINRSPLTIYKEG